MSEPLWAAVELAAVDHLADNSPRAQALALLAGIREVRAALAELESGVVAQARRHDATWDQVGDETGMTKQGARKKWGPDNTTPRRGNRRGVEKVAAV